MTEMTKIVFCFCFEQKLLDTASVLSISSRETYINTKHNQPNESQMFAFVSQLAAHFALCEAEVEFKI